MNRSTVQKLKGLSPLAEALEAAVAAQNTQIQGLALIITALQAEVQALRAQGASSGSAAGRESPTPLKQIDATAQTAAAGASNGQP